MRTVGFLLLPGFSLMSYAAAVEPLRAANQLAGRTLYGWLNVGVETAAARPSNGAAIVPDVVAGSGPVALDMLFVCAGGDPAGFHHPRLFAWLRRLARHGIPLGGISGGPVILAKAGLLAGRRCTVHWEHAPFFEENHPDIRLEHSLFEIDGDRISCAGGISALDMMIHLITREHGYELGAAVGEWFLHTHVRQGHDRQRMDLRARFGVSDERVVTALRSMEESLQEPLALDALAARAGCSPRQLQRLFRERLGCGLHERYLDMRLQRAGQMLRETSLRVAEIAAATGFGSPSQFARTYRRRFGHPPQRQRKSATATASAAGPRSGASYSPGPDDR